MVSSSLDERMIDRLRSDNAEMTDTTVKIDAEPVVRSHTLSPGRAAYGHERSTRLGDRSTQH